MVIIFDAGFFLAAIAMVILGLLGMVEKAMPTITVIMWIVFGISAIGCSCMAIGKEESLWKRIVNFIANAIAHTYIGLVLADLLKTLNESSGFDFIGNLIAGGIVMFFGAGILLWAIGTLIDFDDESSWPYGLRLALIVAFLIAIGVYIFQ